MERHLEPQQFKHLKDIMSLGSSSSAEYLMDGNTHHDGVWANLKSPPVTSSQRRKILQDAKRRSDYNRAHCPSPCKCPEVTISSQTEIGQTEESIMVPDQRAYTGRMLIPSSLADIPCCYLGIQGLLDLLNGILGRSYTLDTPSRSSVLEDCIAKNYDFGTAYGRLRSVWDYGDIQKELSEGEAKDIELRRKAVKGNRIYNTTMTPRRVWDLYSNRVVPSWCCEVPIIPMWGVRPISHAWVYKADRTDVWTPINGREWPVPIPKGANLDLIRIEMLNLGLEYTWLDVLCLRQRGGPREDLRVEEWKLDVPTIGMIYQRTHVVCYLSGLGLPLSVKEGDLESDRCWFRRAWTLQEVSKDRSIAGDTPDGPLHAKPIDDVGNYEDEILTEFHQQLHSTMIPHGVYGALSAMRHRISTYPIDRVAGLGYFLNTQSIPAYYESQSLEDAWTALVNVMGMNYQGILFFTYPEPGTGCKKWRPSWKQVMEKPLPKDLFWDWAPDVNDDDWRDGPCIESGFVRGLAVGGEEGVDRYGELAFRDADGIARGLYITARHQYPILDDTYTLLGDDPSTVWFRSVPYTLQHWVVGRRLPNKMFEKVSVFETICHNGGWWPREVGLRSGSILA
ncbi:hypothetical protein IW261DRAFT_205142 [Armillaria novae-zelandiae]|uniref:Heterokaryon incompatibility domain-containing protein n=1 Tax=Armillaria novae-zelandiae TaxID=153914 RepID=A0AA39P5U7_9AGAR|nr:hypothetical protein IW261DRAFT_205142 [Armillaria novae-zelandiae]